MRFLKKLKKIRVIKLIIQFKNQLTIIEFQIFNRLENFNKKIKLKLIRIHIKRTRLELQWIKKEPQ